MEADEPEIMSRSVRSDEEEAETFLTLTHQTHTHTGFCGLDRSLSTSSSSVVHVQQERREMSINLLFPLWKVGQKCDQCPLDSVKISSRLWSFNSLFNIRSGELVNEESAAIKHLLPRHQQAAGVFSFACKTQNFLSERAADYFRGVGSWS